MMLIGYCTSIRSDRWLCQVVALDLACRWFCRLGLEDRAPDHSTFSINRHGRFRDSDILRKVFESAYARREARFAGAWQPAWSRARALPWTPRCCPKSPERRVPCDVNEAARDHARALMGTEPFLQSRRQRKKIETRFGDLKWNLGLTRLRLRGLSGASDEFLLIATVQNLRRLAKLAAIPPPRPVIA